MNEFKAVFTLDTTVCHVFRHDGPPSTSMTGNQQKAFTLVTLFHAQAHLLMYTVQYRQAAVCTEMFSESPVASQKKKPLASSARLSLCSMQFYHSRTRQWTVGACFTYYFYFLFYFGDNKNDHLASFLLEHLPRTVMFLPAKARVLNFMHGSPPSLGTVHACPVGSTLPADCACPGLHLFKWAQAQNACVHTQSN